MKPAPGVSRRSVALAISCGADRVMAERRPGMTSPSLQAAAVAAGARGGAGSALAHHVLLQLDDDLDQPAPGIFESDAGAREVLPRSLASSVLSALAVGRRPAAATSRPAAAAAAAARARRRPPPCRPATSSLRRADLLLERGAVFRHRLAGPADCVRTAERDLPGSDCRGAGSRHRRG